VAVRPKRAAALLAGRGVEGVDMAGIITIALVATTASWLVPCAMFEVGGRSDN
jgi:hypothetical protein